MLNSLKTKSNQNTHKKKSIVKKRKIKDIKNISLEPVRELTQKVLALFSA